MKKILFFSVSVAIFVATACMAGGTNPNAQDANNNSQTTEISEKPNNETREIGEFSKLDVAINVNLRLVQGAESKVVVNASPELQKRITCKNEGGKLSISEQSSAKMWNKSEEKAQIIVYFKSLTELKAANNGNMEGAINQPNALTLRLTSNGETKLELTAAKLDIDLACNGSVILKGTATTVNMENSSNGDLDAEALKTVALTLKNESNGETSVFASNKIEIDNASNGDLHYYGNPATKIIKNDGNGTVAAK